MMLRRNTQLRLQSAAVTVGGAIAAWAAAALAPPAAVAAPAVAAAPVAGPAASQSVISYSHSSCVANGEGAELPPRWAARSPRYHRHTVAIRQVAVTTRIFGPNLVTKCILVSNLVTKYVFGHQFGHQKSFLVSKNQVLVTKSIWSTKTCFGHIFGHQIC